MADNRHRDTPPGEDGVERRGQEPRAKEVIHFLGFVGALLGGEDARDTRKVNATEGNCEDGSPAETSKRQIP